MWIKSGNDANLKALCKDADGNIITNLASASEIICQIKTEKNGTAKIEKKKTDSEILVDDPSEGYLKIIIDASDTEDLADTYFIGVQIQWTGNKQEINLEDELGSEFEQIEIRKDVVKVVT